MTVRSIGGQRGFTVLEALICMAIFTALLAGILTTYTPARKLYQGGVRIADAQQNARLAMSEMSREIRMAGYFPENFTTTPPTPLLADPILVATENAVAIHGAADSGTTSEVYLFCLDGGVLRRTRGSQATLNSYVCSSGAVLAEGATALRFTYYGADGDPIPDPPTAPYSLDGDDAGAIPDLSDTTQRSQIRRVVITLTMQTELPGKDPRIYTLTSNVSLRNSS